MNEYNYDNNFQTNGNHMEVDSVHRIDFYTSRITPFCCAVKMVATHLNIPLNEIYCRPFIDNKTVEYKKINPTQCVPTIIDNGFVLWESRAIMQYLCNKNAPDSSLYPKDPELRGTVDRLLNFCLNTLGDAVNKAHFEFTFATEYSASRSQRIIELTNALSFLEIFLINKDYVAGSTLTIADISLLASISHLGLTVEFDLSSYSNIWGWFNRLRRELPYYEQLYKESHAEHRELINNIRETHEEWSVPNVCALVQGETRAEHDGFNQNDLVLLNGYGYIFNYEIPQSGHTSIYK